MKKKTAGGLLARLLGKRAQSKQPASAKAVKKTSTDTASRSVGLTRRQRSIAEIGQLAKIGQRDPARLARLLSALLAKERNRRQVDQQQFKTQLKTLIQRQP